MFGRRLIESSPKDWRKFDIDEQSVAEKLKGRVWWPKTSIDESCASFIEFNMEHTAEAAASESSDFTKTS